MTCLGNAKEICHVPDNKRRSGFAGRTIAHGGFTLIELMITVAVMGILASILLGALWKASITAKEMRTRSLIAKLNNHIMPRWESYRSRRLLFDPSLILNASVPVTMLSPAQGNTRSVLGSVSMKWQPQTGQPLNRRHMQAIRLMAIRELMRIEMPERYQDITLDIKPTVQGSGNTVGPLIVPARTSMSQSYFVKLQAALQVSGNTLPSQKFESAECLYQTITLGLEDGGLGQEHFSQADIGDADGDGWPEFLDAWGNPIFFLRWAPHFFSPLQPRWNPNVTVAQRATDPYFGLDPNSGVPDATGKMLGVADAEGSHDPFDLMHDDHDAFALTPLIYSAGKDGIYDIVVLDYVPSSADDPGMLKYNTALNYFDPGRLYEYFTNNDYTNIATCPPGTNDFYNPTTYGSSPFAGAAKDTSNDSFTSPGPANGRLNHLDNIHNHVLGK